ncbi:PPE domain-containing protein [Mycobacterium sp. M1]|uniref:PPE domain-containing protein n=1 Tax=Mycolicibacter acidiphilus TaxID=2835306 RepID=A0ABS5RK05_9MYCO|nr:PPE domain-containing protein [Mycolicibacter acidiphilus]MBS9533826.1 PPE domain-containing protein [Mycolicibacter acidiphilus]
MTGFAGLPPEVVSGRLYAGSGSAPLVAAASAWDRLAATLGSAAASYRSVVTELVDESWQGAASAAMAAAAQPYVEWMNATAAQAAATANQVRAAAAAFEAAHAGAVPPAAVAAHRAALTSLVSGKVLGQNSGAIAANQAEYGSMWAQDAAVMQTYAAGSAAATKSLPALTAAPQTTNQTAGAAPTSTGNPLIDFLNNNGLASFLHSDAVQALSTLAGGLTPFYGSTVQLPALTTALAGFVPAMPSVTAIAGSQAFAGATGAIPAFAAASVSSESTSKFTLAGATAPAAPEVSAGVGRATPVGKLSVPPSWTAANPQGVRLASAAMPLSGAAGAPQAGMGATGGCPGMIPPVAGAVNTSAARRPAGWSDSTMQVIPRLAKAGGDDGSVTVEELEAEDTLSEYEERELDELRTAIAELAEKRDAAARSIREALR